MNIPLRCFRVRLGGNLFGGVAMGLSANPCRRSHVAATRTHLDVHRRHQRGQNDICRGQEIIENGEESCDSHHSLSMLSTASGQKSLPRRGHGARREPMPKESCGRYQNAPGRSQEGPAAPQ